MAYKDTTIKSGVLREGTAGSYTGGYVEHGFGQVEPNHLSAQRTGQIYAQLPTASNIKVLENGQFVKYDYKNGEVNFSGAGEWMLVFNEIKTYHDGESAADFAMIKGNYLHHVYSPYDGELIDTYQSRYYGPNGYQVTPDGQYTPVTDEALGYITTPARDDVKGSTINPFANLQKAYSAKKMEDPRAMVPRVFKTNIGDIFTTNTIKETELELGDELAIGQNGYLVKEGNKADNAGDMKWQVVKVYTMPDGQQGVKIMRIA